MTMRKIYLAGPMGGIPHFNYPAFHRAADDLRLQGWEVFSPAEADIDRHGDDISLDNTTGSIEQAAYLHGFCRREALKVDTSWICDEADAIAMLPGWERSTGAFAEWALAKALDLEILYL